MKHIAATVMGFLAGGLVYFASSPLSPPTPVVLLITCWLATGYLLYKGAATAAQVLERGFLLGAVGWLLIIVGAFSVAAIVGDSNSIFKTFLLSGISLFMSLLFLACFAIVHFWRREAKPEQTPSSSVGDTR